MEIGGHWKVAVAGLAKCVLNSESRKAGFLPFLLSSVAGSSTPIQFWLAPRDDEGQDFCACRALEFEDDLLTSGFHLIHRDVGMMDTGTILIPIQRHCHAHDEQRTAWT